MAKKLSEDYIKFTLSLSTSEAQQEIRKLEKATQGLKEENKSLKKAMADNLGSTKTLRNSSTAQRTEAS